MLPNTGMSFTPFDPLPASDLNDLVENIEALSDGTGIINDAILTRHIANSNVTYPKLSLTTMPAFLAYPSASQNLTGGGAAVAYQCNTEVYDQASNYNNTTYVFTCPTTGIYEFFIFAAGGNGTSSRLIPAIKVNSTTYNGSQNTDTFSSGYCHLQINLTAGDTVQPMISANPANIPTSTGVASGRFSGKRIA